jgi:protein-tyrosine phosphatase
MPHDASAIPAPPEFRDDCTSERSRIISAVSRALLGLPFAMLKVLFVCTGNICRSPTAEGVFRAMVERQGLGHRITTDSCGTHDYHIGDPPDSRACAHALKRGYDIGGLRARMLEPDDFARFDLLVALDGGHERILKRQAPPDAKDKVRLFTSYVPALRMTDVPDPYYAGPEAFDHALDLIERGCAALLEDVCARLA